MSPLKRPHGRHVAPLRSAGHHRCSASGAIALAKELAPLDGCCACSPPAETNRELALRIRPLAALVISPIERPSSHSAPQLPYGTLTLRPTKDLPIAVVLSERALIYQSTSTSPLPSSAAPAAGIVTSSVASAVRPSRRLASTTSCPHPSFSVR